MGRGRVEDGKRRRKGRVLKGSRRWEWKQEELGWRGGDREGNGTEKMNLDLVGHIALFTTTFFGTHNGGPLKKKSWTALRSRR